MGKTISAPLVITAFALLLTISVVGQHPVIKCPGKEGELPVKKVAANLPLFEVSGDYAMEVEFDDHGCVSTVTIAPKYVWQYKVPQWEEPNRTVSMNENQYRDFLSLVNNIKGLGSLRNKSKGSVRVVTNSKTDRWDEYEQSFVRRTLHCCPGNGSELAFSFTVYYVRQVEGTLTGLRRPQSSNDFQITRVKIDDDWYLISARGVKETDVGKHAKLNVAGPVN